MPYFICAGCGTRRVDHDGREGLGREPPSCPNCSFGFMFQLLEDYYPAQATGFIVCDRDARVLATGAGVFELTGFRERDLLGRDIVDDGSWVSLRQNLELIVDGGESRVDAAIANGVWWGADHGNEIGRASCRERV